MDVIKIVLFIVAIVIIICAIPVTAIWCLNSIAEAGGSDFYVDHTPWNYFVAFITVVLINGQTGK